MGEKTDWHPAIDPDTAIASWDSFFTEFALRPFVAADEHYTELAALSPRERAARVKRTAIRQTINAVPPGVKPDDIPLEKEEDVHKEDRKERRKLRKKVRKILAGEEDPPPSLPVPPPIVRPLVPREPPKQITPTLITPSVRPSLVTGDRDELPVPDFFKQLRVIAPASYERGRAGYLAMTRAFITYNLFVDPDCRIIHQDNMSPFIGMKTSEHGGWLRRALLQWFSTHDKLPQLLWRIAIANSREQANLATSIARESLQALENGIPVETYGDFFQSIQKDVNAMWSATLAEQGMKMEDMDTTQNTARRIEYGMRLVELIPGNDNDRVTVDTSTAWIYTVTPDARYAAATYFAQFAFRTPPGNDIVGAMAANNIYGWYTILRLMGEVWLELIRPNQSTVLMNASNDAFIRLVIALPDVMKHDIAPVLTSKIPALLPIFRSADTTTAWERRIRNLYRVAFDHVLATYVAHPQTTSSDTPIVFHPYQRTGIEWLVLRDFEPLAFDDIRGGVGCLQPGMGKTFISIMAAIVAAKMCHLLRQVMAQSEADIWHEVYDAAVQAYKRQSVGAALINDEVEAQIKERAKNHVTDLIHYDKTVNPSWVIDTVFISPTGLVFGQWEKSIRRLGGRLLKNDEHIGMGPRQDAMDVDGDPPRPDYGDTSHYHRFAFGTGGAENELFIVMLLNREVFTQKETTSIMGHYTARRIVIDEYHEYATTGKRYKKLKTTFEGKTVMRWGLTGTMVDSIETFNRLNEAMDVLRDFKAPAPGSSSIPFHALLNMSYNVNTAQLPDMNKDKTRLKINDGEYTPAAKRFGKMALLFRCLFIKFSKRWIKGKRVQPDGSPVVLSAELSRRKDLIKETTKEVMEFWTYVLINPLTLTLTDDVSKVLTSIRNAADVFLFDTERDALPLEDRQLVDAIRNAMDADNVTQKRRALLAETLVDIENTFVKKTADPAFDYSTSMDECVAMKIIDIIRDQVSQKQRTLVFAGRLAPLRALKALFDEKDRALGEGIIMLSGRTLREHEKAFKKFASTDVTTYHTILATMQKIGVGANLDVADTVILLEETQSYKQYRQVIGRSWRLKQTRNVTIYTVQLPYGISAAREQSLGLGEMVYDAFSATTTIPMDERYTARAETLKKAINDEYDAKKAVVGKIDTYGTYNDACTEVSILLGDIERVARDPVEKDRSTKRVDSRGYETLQPSELKNRVAVQNAFLRRVNRHKRARPDTSSDTAEPSAKRAHTDDTKTTSVIGGFFNGIMSWLPK